MLKVGDIVENKCDVQYTVTEIFENGIWAIIRFGDDSEEIQLFNNEFTKVAPTKVIFRVDQHGIVALFPEEVADPHLEHCTCYASMGGHSPAHCQHVINTTKLATDYYDLADELERIGYVLDVKKRYTHKMFDNRFQKWKEYYHNV